MISGGHLAQLNATELIAARTRRRVMRRIMPFLLVAYLCAYIDRANLGIAKLEMQRDLAFTESIIGLGAGIFGSPSKICLKLFEWSKAGMLGSGQ